MDKRALSEMGRGTSEPAISWLMRLTLDRPKLVSLAAGFTDNASLPLSATRSTLKDMLAGETRGRKALQYGTTQGDPELRRITARNLQKLDSRGFARQNKLGYAPEQVVVTNGSQQLLYLVTEALCDPGDIVLVEDPTYFVYLGIAQSHRLRCRTVPLESDGLNIKVLEQRLGELEQSGELGRVKLLYLVSYFQNPSGVTTSFEKKRAALALLKRFEAKAGHPIYLLEDAAYRELRFDERGVPSALATGSLADRVLYAGTYSKPFATGIRVGFGLVPPEVGEAVVRLKGNHDFGTSNFLQQLLLEAMVSGAYEHHLGGLRVRYQRKAEIMTRALDRHFPKSVTWQKPKGGLYVWVSLPRGVATGRTSRMFRAALKHDVLYVPGELCYADDPRRSKPNHQMRLSFGGASDSDIRLGVKRLGAILKSFCS